MGVVPVKQIVRAVTRHSTFCRFCRNKKDLLDFMWEKGNWTSTNDVLNFSWDHCSRKFEEIARGGCPVPLAYLESHISQFPKKKRLLGLGHFGISWFVKRSPLPWNDRPLPLITRIFRSQTHTQLKKLPHPTPYGVRKRHMGCGAVGWGVVG